MPDKKRILVVDDDPDIVDQVVAILSTEGYEIVTASNQTDAEKVLLAAQPDLSIIDLMMENTDSGFVLCHLIKKNYPNTPVIFLTAVRAATGIDLSGVAGEARSWLKADKILEKPVRPEQLRADVRSLLSGTATADGAHS